MQHDCTSTYDRVPYESYPISWTAPEHLAVTSWLSGGPRPGVDQARMLELGCGDATNLNALAFYRPGMRFVGLDGAQVHIDAARTSATHLGLRNASYHCAAFAEAAKLLEGPFDYITMHGVYSWVDDDDRARLLDLCNQLLAPGGVVYISYNSNPGWNVRGIVRDYLLRRVSKFTDLRAQANAAKDAAADLRQLLEGQDHPYPRLMSGELGLFISGEVPYLVHEYLAPENQAFWHSEFVAQVERHGFEFVAEATLNRHTGHGSDEMRARLRDQGHNRVEVEEAIDMLCYRQFRSSLLCKKPDYRGRPPNFHELREAFFATPLRQVPQEGTACEPTLATFVDPDNVPVSTDNTLVHAGLVAASNHWPNGIPLSEVLTVAHGDPDPAAHPELRTALTDILFLNALGLAHVRLLDDPPAVGANPTLHRLAARQLAQGQSLTTRYHAAFNLQGWPRRLIEAWAQTLDSSAAIDTVLASASDDPTLADAPEPEHLAHILRETLASLRNSGILV